MRGRSGSYATSSAYGLSVHPPQSRARQLPAGRQRLLVLGSEIGGRWNEGSQRFVRDLVRLRALRAPPAVTSAAAAGWATRWWALFPSRSSSPSPVPRLAAPGQQLHSRGQVTALLWTVSLTLLRTKEPVAFRCRLKAEHLRMMRDACAEDGRHLPDAGGGRDKAADGSGELEMQRDVIG
ncbi:hypothetical protein AK812_SmicGene28125 [Symbiodinium microadriaticum]|uniref:Uncharacterized protein n=1 Tax=Symbiodinium microadriaticum TaxID=2951 RepID=A0A1Q9D563_SYMMI|nr:hypothetical protein AK812_SmicGene28125 [Symbiodinium microadriaticum]